MSTTACTSNTAQHSNRLKINGELVVWTGERLDFDALQRGMVNTSATVRRRLVVEEPASFVAFDVLAVDGVEIRKMRWSIRRRRLESLAENWRPPLQLSPATADIAEARRDAHARCPEGEISGSPQLSVSCRNARRLGIAVVGR